MIARKSRQRKLLDTGRNNYGNQTPLVMKYQISSAMISESSFICQFRVRSSGIFILRGTSAQEAGAAGGGGVSCLEFRRSSVFSALER